MNYSAISIRYSKAFYQLAKEKNIIDEVYKDILLLQNLITEAKDFHQLIESPVIPTTKKLNVIHDIFKSRIQEVTYKFLILIFKNKRDNFLVSILRNFQEMYKTDKGIKTLILTTAVPINDNLKNELRTLVKSIFKVEPEFHEVTNEKIIGGFVLRVDDQMIDSSISTCLKKFRKELIR